MISECHVEPQHGFRYGYSPGILLPRIDDIDAVRISARVSIDRTPEAGGFEVQGRPFCDETLGDMFIAKV